MKTFFLLSLLSLSTFIFSACSSSTSSTTSTTDDSTTNTTTTSSGSYTVVDTGQDLCFDSTSGDEVTCNNTGYDADYSGNQPSYSLSSSGAVVTDNVTGLMWTQSSDIDNDGVYTDAGDKLSQDNAIAHCTSLSLDGYTDWRLPDIKTSYSLMQFTGQDPSAWTGTDTSVLETFLDPIFARAFGDTDNGDRTIDAQYVTTSTYVATTMSGDSTMFGVNFVDGRIKGYPIAIGGTDKLYYVQCVRGDENYGKNNFSDNGDSTISDDATALMWQQDDSSSTGFDDAINTCEASSTASHTDWRLPNIKELQSILDYSRSPDTDAVAAIDPMFNSTSFTNEEGELDWGYYWSSTTHQTTNADATITKGDSAAYISFGRALGYTSSGGGGASVMDVHGAGAQRSDDKTENVTGNSSIDVGYGTFYYFGPQGDIRRINNKVRCVRSI